ncbi:MAG: hypothetical protein VKJ04_01890 [Vampirovibrionales bacterium]|nr:hypothetical protein [Vampirovibrionales bacterium]
MSDNPDSFDNKEVEANKPPLRNNRWYDKQQEVKQSIELLGAFPEEILSVMSEGVNSVIERDYNVNELMRSFRSLGQDKVLALYKSKNKLRTLDQNPSMHKTVNYLFVVAEENRKAIAVRVLELVGTVHDYLQICKETGLTPTIEHIARIGEAFVAKGNVEARDMLEDVRREMMQIIVSGRKAQASPPAGAGTLEIKGDEAGMRLNLNHP